MNEAFHKGIAPERLLCLLHRRAEVRNQPLLPCLPSSECFYVLNWDFSIENAVNKKNASDCHCVWMTPKSGKVSFLRGLPRIPAPWFCFPCPCPKALSPFHQHILLDWPKEYAMGLLWPTIMSCLPRGSLQKPFQCSCSWTCLQTEHATSHHVLSCAMTLTLYLCAELQSNPESHMEVITNLWDGNDCEYFFTLWIVLTVYFRSPTLI